MPKKNKENVHNIKWSAPPFSRIIKISELNLQKINKYKVNLCKKEIISLEKFLDVKSIDSFNCVINFIPLRNNWEINGKVSITCTLQCVISLEDLKYKLLIPIKRFLLSNLTTKNNEIINYETDPLTENIDLGNVLSEEIYLSIPKYPKKKGVKLENILITEEDTKLNPFKKLENLKI
ncbi:MAG: YceD family protein [Paracoccaceae bacterium]